MDDLAPRPRFVPVRLRNTTLSSVSLPIKSPPSPSGYFSNYLPLTPQKLLGQDTECPRFRFNESRYYITRLLFAIHLPSPSPTPLPPMADAYYSSSHWNSHLSSSPAPATTTSHSTSSYPLTAHSSSTPTSWDNHITQSPSSSWPSSTSYGTYNSYSDHFQSNTPFTSSPNVYHSTSSATTSSSLASAVPSISLGFARQQHPSLRSATTLSRNVPLTLPSESHYDRYFVRPDRETSSSTAVQPSTNHYLSPSSSHNDSFMDNQTAVADSHRRSHSALTHRTNSESSVRTPSPLPVVKKEEEVIDGFVFETPSLLGMHAGSGAGNSSNGMKSGNTPRSDFTNPPDMVLLEVPLRATQASKEMRKLMGSFRLNPFAVHNGVRSGANNTQDGLNWLGEPIGPLKEEGVYLEFQLRLVRPLIDGLDDESVTFDGDVDMEHIVDEDDAFDYERLDMEVKQEQFHHPNRLTRPLPLNSPLTRSVLRRPTKPSSSTSGPSRQLRSQGASGSSAGTSHDMLYSFGEETQTQDDSLLHQMGDIPSSSSFNSTYDNTASYSTDATASSALVMTPAELVDYNLGYPYRSSYTNSRYSPPSTSSSTNANDSRRSGDSLHTHLGLVSPSLSQRSADSVESNAASTSHHSSSYPYTVFGSTYNGSSHHVSSSSSNSYANDTAQEDIVLPSFYTMSSGSSVAGRQGSSLLPSLKSHASMSGGTSSHGYVSSGYSGLLRGTAASGSGSQYSHPDRTGACYA
ncbi:hypothetical protein ABKN59_005181 [Abortiporus biennis]